MVNVWLLVVNAWLMDGFYIIYIYIPIWLVVYVSLGKIMEFDSWDYDIPN